nr:hypothetical protein [Tanacetum cinerariifolium]
MDNILSLTNRFEDILGVTTSSDEAIRVEANMDVKSAFLYGTIDEEVYVMQPPGFQDPAFPKKNGFQRGTIDQTLFIRRQREDFILIQVYVDDIIFGSSNPQLCREFEALMHVKFQMSTMGELNFFLGLQVLQKEDGIFLSQDKPDIMFAICAYARHQVTPKECHLHAVKRIFLYLKGHPKLRLWYPKASPFDLVAFSDSDYGGASQNRKSTTRGRRFQYLVVSIGMVEHVMRSFVKGNIHLYTLFEEFNSGFHPMVDFIAASPLKYALTVKPTVFVSHIRQFWSTARFETTDEGTHILATVDSISRTVSESSLRHNLKLRDEDGIVSISDTELFENLTLMGFTWTFFLKSKDETSGILKKFITEIENLKDLKVKIIRCDNGGEFKNKEMNDFCLQKGIKREVSNARTPQQNDTKDATSQEVKKDASSLRYIALPNWAHDALLEFSSIETPIPTVSSPVLTAYSTNSQKPSSDARLISKRVANQEETPSLDNILSLTNWFEDILRVTTNSDESNGVKADISNMETTITASPTPTLIIHKDHPKSQIIGPLDTLIQTRNKSKEVEEQSFIATIHQKTDPALLQFCLFSCFLSQVEPKKIYDALQDPSWVLKNKKDERGIAIRNKARLGAQGHTQEEGIDYDEVFAPVARIKAIKLFLAYASFMGFTVYQMDVKSAFLYGTIDEEVYVMQPSGFQDPKFLAKVYKVEKAMYGLHQAPRAWQREDFILVQVYVDDIVFGSSNPQLCREFEALMHEKFQMSAMGELNFFLGLQVLQKEDGIFLSQDKPDIMFAVCACARHQVTPKEWNLHAVKRIFRYLNGHPKLGLWYPKESPFDLVAYSDSDYGGATQDRKSTTGGCQFLGRRLISWQCKKQTIVATLTTEAEYVAAASCCGQVLWIQNQLLDYGYNFMNTNIYIDNNSAICIVKNPVYHSKTKHIEIRHHLIRDCFEKKLISMDHIHTDENVADLLTKPFDAGRFQYLVVRTSKYWGVLRILMISLRLIPLKSEYNIDFHPMVDFIKASPLRIVPFFKAMLVQQGEGSGTPTEPHHTPSLKALPPSPTTHSSLTLPPFTTTSIPAVTPSETTPIKQYTRRARIAQSSALPTVTDEPASPLRDVSQGEACPTDSGFIADQDRATIAKSFTLPYDSAPRITSPAADEGSMQPMISELTALCTSLQRQHSELLAKFQAQEVEINRLKERVKLLKDRDRVAAQRSRDDAPIKCRSLDEREAATERSGSIPTASPPADKVPTGSDVVPTASPVFATATVVTPYRRRKGKEVMAKSKTLKKQRVQEQIDDQLPESWKSNWKERIREDRNNETVAKYLQEYHQFALELPMERRIDLISDLVKYQDNYANESAKKQKISEEVTEEAKTPDEVPEEKVKEMMQLVPIDEVYVEALQVKHPIIDWKETLSNRPPTSDKEMELWVELSRLYEPDHEDQLWTHTQNFMHAPVEWKLYDSCGVHHVTSKDKEIFMLVEKDYPLRKGLALVMISYKHQVENYSQMGRIVRNKMHKAFLLPVIEFPPVEELPTASEESCHCQKKSKATAVKIALLSKVNKKLSVKFK